MVQVSQSVLRLVTSIRPGNGIFKKNSGSENLNFPGASPLGTVPAANLVPLRMPVPGLQEWLGLQGRAKADNPDGPETGAGT